MDTNKQYKSLRLGFAALVYALILFFVLLSSMSGGIISSTSDSWGFWYYFTNQSNIIVLVWLILFGIGTIKGGKAQKLAENNTVITAVTVYISITFFIVATVLEPFYSGKFEPLNSLFLHFASAIVMWFFFFFVKGHGSQKYRQAFYMLIYPFVYLIVCQIVGHTTNFIDGKPAFPYAFINPSTYGNVGVFIVVILLLIGIFGGFGVLLIKFRRFLTRYHQTLQDPNMLQNQNAVPNPTYAPSNNTRQSHRHQPPKTRIKFTKHNG